MWVALSSYWMVGFGFAVNIVMTRLLAPEVFGVVALASFWAQLFRIQPKLGLGYAFAQHKETTGKAVGTYVSLEASSALAGVVLSLIAMPVLIAVGYSGTIVTLMAVLAFAAALETGAGIAATLLDRELQFRQASMLQSIAFSLSYVPAVWLAVTGGGVWSLVAQTVTYNFLFLIAIWFAAHRQLPQVWRLEWRFDYGYARRFLRFGITVGLGLMAGMLLTQLDNFLIGTFVGLTMLGFYDRAYRTAQWPSTLLNAAVGRAAFYTYARLQNDPARLHKSVTMVLWIISGLALPLALSVFVTAPDLLRLLYGDRWLPAAPFLRVLVLVSVVRPLWENAGTLFVAVGKPHLTLRLTLMQAAVLAAAGLPLTLVFGAGGTVAAVALAFLIGVILSYREVNSQLSLDLVGSLGGPLLAAALTIAGYVILNQLLGLTTSPFWHVSWLKRPTRLSLSMRWLICCSREALASGCNTCGAWRCGGPEVAQCESSTLFRATGPALAELRFSRPSLFVGWLAPTMSA